jgi:hypothetical protein
MSEERQRKRAVKLKIPTLVGIFNDARRLFPREFSGGYRQINGGDSDQYIYHLRDGGHCAENHGDEIPAEDSDKPPIQSAHDYEDDRDPIKR